MFDSNERLGGMRSFERLQGAMWASLLVACGPGAEMDAAVASDAGAQDAAMIDAASVEAGEDAAAMADAGPPLHNVAFLTSSRHDGDLGGLAGADATCQTLAEGAGLPGRFVALLSDADQSAIDRLDSASGWVRTDGLP